MLENFGNFVSNLLRQHLEITKNKKDILELGSGLGYLITSLYSIQEDNPDVINLIERIQETEESQVFIDETIQNFGRKMTLLDATLMRKKIKENAVTAVIALNFLDANPLCFHTESLLKDIHYILKPGGLFIHIKDLPILPDLPAMLQPFLKELSPFPFFKPGFHEVGIQWLNPSVLFDSPYYHDLEKQNSSMINLLHLFILNPEKAFRAEYPDLIALDQFIQQYFKQYITYAEQGRDWMGWLLKIYALKIGFSVIENKTMYHDTIAKNRHLYESFFKQNTPSYNTLKHEDADLIPFYRQDENDVVLSNLIQYTVLKKK